MIDVTGVKKKYGEQLRALPNVVGVFEGRKTVAGIRLDEPALVVFVKKKKPIERSMFKRILLRRLHPANAVPSVIEGVQTDVVQSGEIVIFQEDCTKHPVIGPGAGISHPDVTCGTFGAVAIDNETGKQVVVTNNHVAANSNKAEIGDDCLYPCAHCGGGDAFGKLGKFVPIELTAIPCPILNGFVWLVNAGLELLGRHSRVAIKEAAGENLVDAAMVIPNKGVKITSEVPEIGKPSPGVMEAYVGQRLKKTGWRTWDTEGEVTGINGTIQVGGYGAGIAIFTDQIIIGPVNGAVSAPGDSGSMFFSDKIKAVGLLFAGSEEEKITIANRAANVEELLGVRFG